MNDKLNFPSETEKPDSPIILRCYDLASPGCRRLNGTLRVTPEAELAVRRLSAYTGLTQRDVASELIIQAAAICQVVKGGER